ncbi:hypothetical protein JCM8547_004229 [Rhodosporidiobolus lusitaniae]
MFAPDTPSRVLRNLERLNQQSLPDLPDLPSELPSFSEDGDSTVAHSPPQRKRAALVQSPRSPPSSENLPPPTPYSSTPAPSLYHRTQSTIVPVTGASHRSANDTTATIGPNGRFSSVRRGGRSTPTSAGSSGVDGYDETTAEHSVSEIAKAPSLDEERDEMVVLSGGSGAEDNASHSVRARQTRSAGLSALPLAQLKMQDETEDRTTDHSETEADDSAPRPHPLDSLGPLANSSAVVDKCPISPRPASPKPNNNILPATLSPLRQQETTTSTFPSPEVARHSSPRNSPHSFRSYGRENTPSRVSSNSPSDSLTPHGAKTPHFDSPLASLDFNANPTTPAANHDAAERRKAHLLGTLRSTAKHTLTRGTPHPSRSARKPSPSSAGAGEDAADHTSSSFGSDRSSNDLTTFHKANTSLPSGGSAEVGGAVSGGARSSRFNGAKLNAYLHSLNTHLTEENKSLAKAVSRVTKDFERMEGENRRLNDTLREMSVAGGITVDLSRRNRTTSIEEEDEGERSRVEMLGDELEGLVSRQRKTRELQDQLGAEAGSERVKELEDLVEQLRSQQAAQDDELRQLREQVSAGGQADKSTAEETQDGAAADQQARIDDLRAELDEARKQREDQEIEFADAMKQLEEELCKLTEDQEASLEQARKELQELKALRAEDATGRKADGEKIAQLEAERDELEHQLLEGGTDAAKEVEEKLHGFRDEVARLEETASTLRSDIAARDEALERMQAEVEKAERKVEELERSSRDLGDLRRQLADKDAELQQLDEAFEDSAQQLVQHEDTIESLQKQLDTEQKKSSALSAQLSQLSLPKTKSPLANEVYNSAKDEVIASLEEELGEARKEVDELKEQLAATKQEDAEAEIRELEIKKLKEDKANLEGRIKSLREQSVLFSPSRTPDKSWMLRPLPSVLTPKTPGQFLSNLSLRSSGSAANETITPDLMQIAELQQVVETLRTQISQAYEDVDDKIGKLDSAGSSNLSLARQLSNAEFRIAQLEDQLDGLLGEGGSLERVKARLAKVHCPDCQTPFNANKNVQLRVGRDGISFAGSTPRRPEGDSLRTTLANANAKLRELQVENGVLQEQASRSTELQADKVKILQQVETLQRELQQARDELAVLETDLRTERSRLRTQATEQSYATKTTATLEARASTAEANLKKQLAEVDSLRNERATILRGVASLQDELKRIRDDATRHGLDVAAAKKESEELTWVQEALLVSKRKVVLLEKEIADHVCSAATDSSALLELKNQHKLEVRGAMKRILQLQREVSREFLFRSMCEQQKGYLKSVIEEKQATINLVLSEVSTLMGTPPPVLNPPVKLSLRNVATAIIAINRMRRLAAVYAPEVALKKQFRERDYPRVRGKPYPAPSRAP